MREHIHGGHYHVTFEPMFDDVGVVDLTGIDWIVIGTETGHRKANPHLNRIGCVEPDTSGPCAWHPCIHEGRSTSYHGRGTDGTGISTAFYRVLEEQKTWRK